MTLEEREARGLVVKMACSGLASNQMPKKDTRLEAIVAECFGRHLETAMRFRGVEQINELARRSRIDASVLSRIRGGKQSPSLAQVLQLSIGLDCPPSELVPPDSQAALARYFATKP